MNTYKDDSYQNTIERVQKILHENNITTTVKEGSGFKGTYYANLKIDHTSYGTNGKGVSKEQVIAGAYGELMERLQNRVFFRFYNTFVMEEGYKHIYLHNEIEKNLNEIVENKKYLGAYFNMLSEDKARELIKFSLCIHSKREQDKNCFLSVPYYCNGKGKVTYLPAELIKHIYATNGMCAGNTEEEALVQGISEIFERYSNYVLLQGKITPPDIPREVLMKYKDVKEFLENIEKIDNYEVSFKDCSLGMGLPVVSLVIFDKSNGKYFVKFGSHPVMEVALSRTITEMFQGRKIGTSAFWFKDAKFYENTDYTREFKKIFRSGDGEYPTKFFDMESTYEYNSEWEKVTGSNHQLYELLKDNIRKNGWNLLYCDMSFLKFPAYHIIIPEISQIGICNEKFISIYRDRLRVNQLLRKLPLDSDEELSEIVEFLLHCDYSLTTRVREFLDISLQEEKLIQFESMLLGDIVLIYYLKHDRYQEVLDIIDTILESAMKASMRCYYTCLRNYIKAVYIVGEKDEKVRGLLYKFYEKSVADKVMDMVHRKEQIFQKMPILKCGDCEECAYKNSCSKRYAYELNKKILERWEDDNVRNSKEDSISK